jgi:parallel beta-helix repeat protein
VSFRPGQVVRGGRLLELAHTARRGSNPWQKVRQATATTLTLPGLGACTDLTGARVRVRTSLYEINEGVASASSGNTLSVAGFEGAKGWGAYAEGKRCLLDEPGEWFWRDGTLSIVSAKRPTGVRATPHGKSAINAGSSSHLAIRNVIVRNGVTGINLSDARGAQLHGVRVERASEFGIDAGCARHLTLTNSSVQWTGRDGLMVGYCGKDVTVTGSRFAHIGTVLMPRKSDAAIFGGFTVGMTIEDNMIRDVQYIGIRVHQDAVVARNRLTGMCRILEDCGAIYVFDRAHVGLRTRIVHNTIREVRGNPQGREKDSDNWWVDGLCMAIYLDDNASRVVVARNDASDYDYGLMLHGAINNRIHHNTFNGAQRGHVFLNNDIDGPLMQGNVLTSNRFGATQGLMYDVYDEFGGETGLAVYRDNRYPRAHPFAELGSYGEVTLTRWRELVDDS